MININMKVKEILFEQPFSEKILDMSDNNIKILQKECSQILEIYNKSEGVLYRGSPTEKPSFFKAEIRQNRHPRDSSRIIQSFVEYVMKRLNIKARRNNSLFVTSRIEMAYEYTADAAIETDPARLFVIFPTNGFNFTWAENASDGIEWISNLRFPGNYNKNVSSDFREKTYSKLDMFFYIRLFDKPLSGKSLAMMPGYRNFLEDFAKETFNVELNINNPSAVFFDIMYNKNNPMSTGQLTKLMRLFFFKNYEKYQNIEFDKLGHDELRKNIEVLLRINDWDPYTLDEEQFSYLFDVNEEYLNKKVKLRTDDITAAINSGHEIMISDCQYYAIRSNEIELLNKIAPNATYQQLPNFDE